MLTKKEVAAQLKEVATLLEVLGDDPFRARAFQNAARAFEAYGGDVEELFRQDRLTELRGVGAGVATELRVMAIEGTLPLLNELRLRVPEGVRELFGVSGLGAKRIATLWQHEIVGLDELVAAGEEGRLAKLPGFGAKSAAAILDSARFVAAARSRMRLDEAERLGVALAEALRGALPRARIELAGEFRRGLETVGRIELVVAGAAAEELRDVLERALDETDEDGLGGSLLGRTVRVWSASEAGFGAALALHTGSDEFAAELRRIAAERGLDLEAAALSGDGLASEEDVFTRLGLPFVPPSLREEARFEPADDLLAPGDVVGAVHNHSTWSDAAFSIREMVAASRSLGFRYLAMADHSRSSYYANGLSIERLRAQAEEIAVIRAELKAEGSDFELLHGLEVDILPDGALDYPDEVLAELDYVVVSVHQNFSLSREEQTERMVRAVRNPYASILGHATGRLLLRRPGYEVDLERVIAACAESGTVIEINANPHRLDLDWRWARRAKELGCRFSIDPDAHHVDGLEDVRYGVMVARKAGLTAADVVNTAPSGRAFLERLKPRP